MDKLRIFPEESFFISIKKVVRRDHIASDFLGKMQKMMGFKTKMGCIISLVIILNPFQGNYERR